MRRPQFQLRTLAVVILIVALSTVVVIQQRRLAVLNQQVLALERLKEDAAAAKLREAFLADFVKYQVRASRLQLEQQDSRTSTEVNREPERSAPK
jgi:hypothetical protein